VIPLFNIYLLLPLSTTMLLVDVPVNIIRSASRGVISSIVGCTQTLHAVMTYPLRSELLRDVSIEITTFRDMTP
jgi:hypothetical protein